MKHSWPILVCFFAGFFCARGFRIPDWMISESVMMAVLYVLLFAVGIGVGADRQALQQVRRQKWTVLILPFATILGTLGGVALASLFLPYIGLGDSLAVGSGFAYYSLSSVLITKVRGVELGVIALASNVLRELVALSCAPYLLKIFGPYAPISVGGATTMDTTLPIIQQTCGKAYVIQSMIHGFLVDLSVPILVTLFISLSS